jgi:dissimilatory sulfite reductase (desulfoviridin) alpha/beta subunit
MTIDLKALKGQGFLQQKQNDRYSVRLKVVGGHLTTSQLKAIVAAAEDFGDGYVHLTSRQAVEIPNVKLEDLEPLKSVLNVGGSENCVLGPKVRTVNACQGQDTCKWGCIQTYSLAVELTDRYYGRELPTKFKLGVTGCRNNCMKVEENDLGIKGGMLVEWSKENCVFCGACEKICRAGALAVSDDNVVFDRSKCLNCGRCANTCPTGSWSGQPAYNVYFGGNFGNGSEVGRQLLSPIVGREKLILVLDAALDFFKENGQPGQRFRSVVERLGWESLNKVLAKVIDA